MGLPLPALLDMCEIYALLLALLLGGRCCQIHRVGRALRGHRRRVAARRVIAVVAVVDLFGHSAGAIGVGGIHREAEVAPD